MNSTRSHTEMFRYRAERELYPRVSYRTEIGRPDGLGVLFGSIPKRLSSDEEQGK